MKFASVRAWAWRLRPVFAALAVICCVGAALDALAGSAPAMRSVLVAAHALDAGTELAASDLELAEVPQALVPEGALGAIEDAEGLRITTSLPAGMPIPADVLLTSSFMAHAPAGKAIVAVPVLGDAAAELASTGMRVALYAPPDEYSEQAESTLVVDDALIVGIARESGSSTLLSAAEESLTFFVAVPDGHAPAVLGHASRSNLQLVLQRE